MTPVKPLNLVPKLRFPEFRDAAAWSSSSLESVCAVLNKRRVPITTKDRKAGPFPYYGASGIVDYVDDFIFDERLILVGEDGAKWGPFEETAFIADGRYWVNNHAHVLRSVDLVDSLLVAYLVRSDLGRYVTGAAPPKLTLGKLKTIPIPIPSSPAEQQKIADCLGLLDDLIAAEGRRLKALQQHKQGLMQQLFPQAGETVPRLRFPEFAQDPGWDHAQVVDLVETVSPPKKLTTSTYLADGRFPIIDQSQSNICGWTNDDEAVITSPLPVIVFGDHTCVLKFVDRPFAQGADGVKILKARRRVSTLYLYQQLTYRPVVTEEYKRHFSALKDKVVCFPDPKSGEQQKIADCLGSLDDLIAAESRKLDTLTQHKQGLLQQLFPSLDGQ